MVLLTLALLTYLTSLWKKKQKELLLLKQQEQQKTLQEDTTRRMASNQPTDGPVTPPATSGNSSSSCSVTSQQSECRRRRPVNHTPPVSEITIVGPTTYEPPTGAIVLSDGNFVFLDLSLHGTTKQAVVQPKSTTSSSNSGVISHCGVEAERAACNKAVVVDFVQARVDTFARNMETLALMLTGKC